MEKTHDSARRSHLTLMALAALHNVALAAIFDRGLMWVVAGLGCLVAASAIAKGRRRRWVMLSWPPDWAGQVSGDGH
jgi:hypothetical protein